MGAVQFVLKGDQNKKHRLTYNEKQKIYNDQNQILMILYLSYFCFPTCFSSWKDITYT